MTHASADTDPRTTISLSPMSRLQIGVVAITVGLNALDGFDVLSISFASPGIAAEWGIDRAALGIVLSMELIGMAGGSVRPPVCPLSEEEREGVRADLKRAGLLARAEAIPAAK